DENGAELVPNAAPRSAYRREGARIHARLRARGTPSTRVKDRVDIVLVSESAVLGAADLLGHSASPSEPTPRISCPRRCPRRIVNLAANPGIPTDFRPATRTLLRFLIRCCAPVRQTPRLGSGTSDVAATRGSAPSTGAVRRVGGGEPTQRGQ